MCEGLLYRNVIQRIFVFWGFLLNPWVSSKHIEKRILLYLFQSCVCIVTAEERPSSFHNQIKWSLWLFIVLMAQRHHLALYHSPAMCYYIKKCENVITGYSSQRLRTKPARSKETGNVCPSEPYTAFPASGLHQDGKRRDGGWLRRTEPSHLPFSRNQLVVNCKCNPDQKNNKKK